MAKKPVKVDRFRAIKVVLISFFCFFLLAAVIESFVQLNATYNNLTAAQSELADEKSENIRLKSKLDAQVSVKNVEEYAEDVLGMQKLDSSQIKYIKIRDKDSVTLPDENVNIFVKIKLKVAEIIDYLKG